MANNLLSETRLSLAELAQRESVNVSTVWRWVLKGVRGHKLESFAIGKRYTTVEAFERFVFAINGSASPNNVRTPRQRQRDIALAEAELKRAGI